jgi:hypothetical protein
LCGWVTGQGVVIGQFIGEIMTRDTAKNATKESSTLTIAEEHELARKEKIQKKESEIVVCTKCKKEFKLKQLFRFSYRYTDKVHTYASSGKKWMHTGYFFVCKKCLDTITSY